MENRKLKLFLPIFDWLPKYNKSFLFNDWVAGLTIGGMMIPQGMAYAKLAGMPPIHGLYASLVPGIIYAIFGTSRQLSVGPVAIASLLVTAGISQIVAPGTQAFVALAFVLALMVGLLKLIFGFFRLGFLVNFLSNPVISGFTSAASVIIILSQLKFILGIEIPRQGSPFDTGRILFNHIDQIHAQTFLLSIAAMVVLFISKRISRFIPSQLVIVVLSIILVSSFGWNQSGIAIVGSIPEGLPNFIIPELDIDIVWTLFPAALSITLVGYVQSMAIAKILRESHKNYRLNPNQELVALGLGNIVASFFQAFPVTGGFARSAVNDAAGAKTPMAGVISALVVGLTLLFLTPLFYYLPTAILSAIIIMAVLKLFDWRTAKKLWRTDKRDFWMMTGTFLATLIIGIEQGILVGMGLSISMMIFYSARPNVVELGRIVGTNHYRSIRRFKDLKVDEEILIVRFDAQVFFANSLYFRERILELKRNRDTKLKAIVISSYGISNIDSTAFDVLAELNEELNEEGIELIFSGLTGPVRDLFKARKIKSKKGIIKVFVSIEDAVDYYYKREPSRHHRYAEQYNA